jgi:hypothetical protein
MAYAASISDNFLDEISIFSLIVSEALVISIAVNLYEIVT